MISTFTLVVIVVIIALVFDFVNGFHDAANAIATIVVSKTLTPLQAVVPAGTSHFGIPLSTTHVISGSIMGVGAVEHAAKVRWITARGRGKEWWGHN